MNPLNHQPWIRSTRRAAVKSPVIFITRLAFQMSTSANPTPARHHDTPFRMAVVGSGPAGFYTAYRVMSRLPEARVDMYESLPVPFGLVRFGVAPDHPEVKNCQDKFEEVASSANFTFIGNTSVGQGGSHQNGCHVDLSTILRHYDAVVLAYGASKDKVLGVPGESSLQGIYSARQFVGWYNGLPEYADLAPDLTKGDEAVIIGQGNVALDVARILLENVDNLRKTDITEEALAHLSKSRVRRVHVVGRRGPMQAAFTIKEVRELMKLPHVGFHPVDELLIPPDLKTLPRPARRLMEVVAKGSQFQALETPKSWSLDFCLSPREFLPSSTAPAEVGRTVFERTDLPDPFHPTIQPQLTGRTATLASSLVFRSIGYQSVALAGFKEAGILFDDRRGIVMNDGLGRVMRVLESGNNSQLSSSHFRGLFCAGWVKRGPTGVIASTMEDSFATGDSVVQDWLSGQPFLEDPSHTRRAGWEGVSKETNNWKNVVHWDDWHKIDRAERERGRGSGKEREKFTNIEDMLAVII